MTTPETDRSAPDHAQTAVIVLAAGSGTRMKSATPKMLHRVCGRTMLGHALHAAAGLEPDAIVVVVGHQRDQVSAAVDELSAELGVPVSTAVQEEQNGTGDAVAFHAGDRGVFLLSPRSAPDRRRGRARGSCRYAEGCPGAVPDRG